MLLDTPTPETNRRLTVTAVQFWTDYEPDPEQPGEMRAVDWVKWAKRGDLNSMAVVEKVARVSRPMQSMSDEGQLEPNPIWTAIEGQFDAWKKGQEVPADGTSLDAWSALSKAQAKAFKDAGFACIEHIAAIEDSGMGKVRLPDTRRLRDLARAYVAHRNQNAPIEAAFAKQGSEIADLKAQLAEATAALQRLAAPDDEAEPPRRGPGRPRKVEQAEDAI